MLAILEFSKSCSLAGFERASMALQTAVASLRRLGSARVPQPFESFLRFLLFSLTFAPSICEQLSLSQLAEIAAPQFANDKYKHYNIVY